MSACNIGCDGAPAIGRAVAERSQNLETLDLGDDLLVKDKSAHVIAEDIGKSRSSKQVYLRGCGIGSGGAEARGLWGRAIQFKRWNLPTIQ